VHSNKYTIFYATLVTIVVAILLSLAATGLKPMQENNVALEKKGNILKCVLGDSLVAALSAEKLEQFYAERIEELVVDHEGNILEGADAFAIDVVKENKRPVEEQRLPVYTYSNEDGSKFYILPMAGNGLWGPIWGYVALKSDFKEIVGASFSHKSETPGLGAEITTQWFQSQFVGEELIDQSGDYAFTVLKGRGNAAAAASEHKIDGISGATVTSVGVDDMFREDYHKYVPFFEKIKSKEIES